MKDYYCKRKDILLSEENFITCHICRDDPTNPTNTYCLSNQFRNNNNITHKELVKDYEQRLRVKKLKRITDD
jgi:hypothetical protein